MKTHYRVVITIQPVTGGWDEDSSRVVASMGVEANTYKDAVKQVRELLPIVSDLADPTGLDRCDGR